MKNHETKNLSDVKSRTVNFIQKNFTKRNDQTLGTPSVNGNFYPDNAESSPTDAFGEVQFNNSRQKIAKYIRVAENTNIDDLRTLMFNHWQMEEPNLLISITGGAQDFTMTPRLKEVFRQGLIKAAQSTHAWIITGGTNVGVMKHVGEMLRDNIIKHGSKNHLVALGIATWGCIKNKEDLISKSGEKEGSPGCWPAHYKIMETHATKGKSRLDPNHTHFILVDDGTAEFGAEIKLRAELESKISANKIENNRSESLSKGKISSESVSIPVVCVVLQGGPNTLKTVKEAIDKGTPAVIVKDSGGAADVLAYAYEKFQELETRNESNKKEAENILWDNVSQEITKKLKKESDINGHVQLVKECIKNIKYMSIFRLDGRNSAKDIDIAILRALLNVNDGIKQQLRLALAWDRVDIAKDEIFTAANFDAYFRFDPSVSSLCRELQLDDLMLFAFRKNRFEFVKLFLDNGLSQEKFITDNLFNKFKKPDTKTETSEDIEYLTSTFNSLNELLKEVFGQKGCLKESSKPSHILFLCCVLELRKEMAMVFMHGSQENLALAVVAHLLLSFKLEGDPDQELNKELSEQIAYYEDLAIGLLSECYSSDQRQTMQLLVRKIPAFNDMTVLKMAVQADNKNFVAHPACQNYLTDVWNGKLINDQHYFKLLLSTLCPFAAPFLLKFEENERKQTTDRRMPCIFLTRRKKDKLLRRDSSDQSNSSTINNAPKSAQNAAATYFQKSFFFFQAPVIKCSYNLMAYIAFLVLYCIILLTDFFPQIGIKEKILIVWIITLIFEEIRQVITDDASDIRQNLYDYFTDIWNVVDVIAILTFLLGLILRFIPVSICGQCFYAARIILALNYMTFFFRILHIYSIHRELGPKLVMIGKMMIDLLYFMLILLVFIIAYGIASHVILYPNQPLDIALARDVLSRSWWNIFGELDIEKVSGDACSNETFLLRAEQCASMEINEFSSFDCREYKALECPSIDWLVPIILAIYAFIMNILMLNLLIAVFSDTLSKIQGQTNVIWKMQRYHLVREYKSRPELPPPLIIFSHIYQLIRYSIRQFSRDNSTSLDSDNFNEEELLNWEYVNAEEYLRKKESENTADMKERQYKERSDLILRELEEVSRRLQLLEKQGLAKID